MILLLRLVECRVHLIFHLDLGELCLHLRHLLLLQGGLSVDHAFLPLLRLGVAHRDRV